MPDITLCADAKCPLKKECRRSAENYSHLSKYQSFFVKSPRGKDGCEEFWRIRVEKDLTAIPD